jgi:hypothetical protein
VSRADVRLQDLPTSARDLAETVGLQSALAIVERWGGVGLWVPVQWRADAPPTQRLLAALGERTARRLWEVYRGTHLDVPKCDRALRMLRDDEIRARKRQGATVARLAREHHLTERQIYNIAAAPAVQDDGQADLFETGA